MNATFRAALMFASTNIDTMVLIGVQLGLAARRWRTVVVGQFLGLLIVVLTALILAEFARSLPLSCLGVVPIVLGVRLLWNLYRRNDAPVTPAVTVLPIALVMVTSSTDNLAVYVPAFAAASGVDIAIYAATFFGGMAMWCALGWVVSRRPLVADLLSRQGAVVMPVVLIALGAAALFNAR